jgi:hypothetical protein
VTDEGYRIAQLEREVAFWKSRAQEYAASLRAGHEHRVKVDEYLDAREPFTPERARSYLAGPPVACACAGSPPELLDLPGGAPCWCQLNAMLAQRALGNG